MMSSKAALLNRSPNSASGGTEWVARFGLTERFAHWWTVSMVATALVTGLALGDEGAESGLLLTAHWGSVVLIGVGLLAALVLGDTRALLRATWRLFSVDRRDATWVRDHLRHPLGGGDHGDYGMFNPAQKALAWALSGAVAVVIYTGIQSLSAGGEDSGGPHAAAVIVAMVLLSAHIFMAAINPATNHALVGMVFGRVRRSWAAKHHNGWLKDQSGEPQPKASARRGSTHD
jgi:formate dehydrogenase subunit gamma